MILTDMLFNSTVIGFSHVRSSKECQDYSLTWQDSSGDCRIAAVSDGHGGDEYVNSATGAQIACQTAIEVLREFASSVRSLSSDSKSEIGLRISRSIIAGWNFKVDSIRNNQPIKTFGCTLIAYLQTPEYWIGLHIGDGKFVIYDRSEWSQPIPWDDHCILNYTTSICDETAVDEFRFAFGSRHPQAVFLSSDGIDSTFEDGELLYNFYSQILTSLKSEGIDMVRKQLPEALAHFSEIGSHDDMSLAAIINPIM